ncbi:MAG TPA: hypothetical protein VKB69_03845, partial [Micromonosporaceae bacterium]|nr:hypothetical protein [Micromonosporaceae bacterium]
MNTTLELHAGTTGALAAEPTAPAHPAASAHPAAPTGAAVPGHHAPAPVDRPDPRRWLILAVLGIAQLMVVLDATIVNIALPSAQEALGFSDESRQW